MHRRAAVTDALAIAISVTAGCGSSASTASEIVCNELFGQGLTGCAELCRPFGVLDFAVIAGPDGTLSWSCECMPAATLDEEQHGAEGAGSAGTPAEAPESPRRHVRPVVIGRGAGDVSTECPTQG